MGEHDQHVEVSVSYLLPEAECQMTWDVRCRTLLSGKWRLVDMSEVDLTDPLLATPGLAVVERVLERFLDSLGVQMTLPFP